MQGRRVVVGQHVESGKQGQATEMRRNMPEAEQLLLRALRANQLRGLHFRRQQIIDGFIVDFYCHRASLVVEVDGPVHADRAEYDAERDQVLGARGLHVLRVSNDDVLNRFTAVIQRIAAAAASRISAVATDVSGTPPESSHWPRRTTPRTTNRHNPPSDSPFPRGPVPACREEGGWGVRCVTPHPAQN